MMESGQALQCAIQSLIQLTGARELADVNGIQVEELELTEGSKHWDVTLSYPVKRAVEEEPNPQVPEALARFLKESPRRKWRTFRLDAQDGHLVSMKIPTSNSAT